jgi:hypothetical protein
VNIQENAALTNVDGLSGITSLGEGLQIDGNTALFNLDGLSNLMWVGWDANIVNNPVLCQSLVDAFIAAGTIGGSVTTSGNNNSC